MKLLEYADREMMMIDVANHLAGELNEHLMVNDRASFAVPGGTTPGPIFDVLCAADIEWDKVTVLPTDERWVPESSDQSNARLIKQHLLTGRAAAASFLPFYVEGAQPEASVGELSALLAPHLPISVIVLGMGADMHTASLFPGAYGLDQALDDDADSFFPMKMPGQAGQRMTLTAQVINGAMSKHVVIVGADKRAALDKAQAIGDPMVAPICAVLAGSTVHWAE